MAEVLWWHFCFLIFLIFYFFTVVQVPPPVNEWIKTLWNIYTMEYYAAERKKELLPFTTVWMELESIMLSDGTYELGYERTTACFGCCISLSLECLAMQKACCQVIRQPCRNTHAARNCCLPGAMWQSLRVNPLPDEPCMTAAMADMLIVIKRETTDQDQPAKLLPDSWPTETVR